jgi:hypothetical protein
MTKKNRKKKNAQSLEEGVTGPSENPLETNEFDSSIEPEVSETSENLIEADQANPKMEPVDVNLDAQDEAMENPQKEESIGGVQESEMRADEADSAQDDSMDDILADVRHSLIEEEVDKGEKKSSWWNRLVKGSANREAPVAPVSDEKEKDVPVPAAPSNIELNEKESGEYVEEIDELIKLLETDDVEDQESVSEIPAQVIPPVEQEVKIDIDELKKQAFTPRPGEEQPEDLSDVRTVALGGEEEVFVEVEAKAEDPWEVRIKTVENALRPYRTYIYYGLAFIGVVMAIMASVLVYNGVKSALPTPVATEAANLPYPTMISLPGGLNFNLAKGTLKDGVWDPRGPEWLEGTEICRWVAIPWSRQLEAAVRTMNQEDVIELHMSNNDKLSYTVESIQELTPAELQEMDSSSPCLALILAKQDSEKRWVAIARP